MNPGLRLAGLLRRLFSFARIAIGVSAVLFIIAHIPGPWAGIRGKLPMTDTVQVADVSLNFKAKEVALRTDKSKPGDLALRDVQGVLVVKSDAADSSLVTILNGVLLPNGLLGIAYYFLLFSCLRRVCANIEGGEMFNDRNLRLVRNIGALMVTYAIVRQVLSMITGVILGLYLNNRVTVPGLDAGLDVLVRLSVGVGTNSPLGDLITGCVVALVGEAFRQGLALKTENDLTV